MKEVQTLSMEVVEFERRAQDRYRSLIDENISLRKQVNGLRCSFVIHYPFQSALIAFERSNKLLHNFPCSVHSIRQWLV